jgi:CRISPR-associated endonuclease/helicase Cas3
LLWRSAKAIFGAGKIVRRTTLECASIESGEVRALVEAVYGEDGLAIPPSLKEAENEALGARSGERTQAHYNTLDFQKGYDWDGMKWERETRVKTRLGEETITLRLARIESGRIIPWMPVENGDLRRSWALSEVSLRKSRCSGADNPPEIQALVEEAQREWTLSEKEMPVLVLERTGGEVWQGTVCGKGANPVRVFYSKLAGLQFAG